MKISDNTPIKIWLYTLVLMVFAMVFIGGITRLTDSGLSMVDWKPLMGVIPPMNQQEWEVMFAKYQNFPEYKLVNHSMTLEEFKKIFFWEYFHRLFGRLIGVVFFFPFLYFVVRKKVQGKLTAKLFVGFILGGLQGLMGWYMVKSGLVDRPDVSQYRLAAHLILAFLIMAYLYWIVMELNFSRREYTKSKPGSKFALAFVVVIILQFTFGAFVAGLDAGLTHNTFPKMGKDWIPSILFETESLSWTNNMVAVQFVHRKLGWLLLFMSLFVFLVPNKRLDFHQRKSIYMLCGMILIQFALGVATLLMYVPIGVASIHQVGGSIILILIVRYLYFSYTQNTCNSEAIGQ